MPQFGSTSPCAEIAKHYGVPQAFVDAMMEIKLYHKGVRSIYPEHTTLYWNQAAAWPDFDTRMDISADLDRVIDHMRQDALERRRKEAAK